MPTILSQQLWPEPSKTRRPTKAQRHRNPDLSKSETEMALARVQANQHGGVCRNKLDLVIVVLALADIFTSSDKVSSVSSVFRIFRVVRLAKVLQQVKYVLTHPSPIFHLPRQLAKC